MNNFYIPDVGLPHCNLMNNVKKSNCNMKSCVERCVQLIFTMEYNNIKYIKNNLRLIPFLGGICIVISESTGTCNPCAQAFKLHSTLQAKVSFGHVKAACRSVLK